MEQDFKYIEEITKKDEQKALSAMQKMLNQSDTEGFKLLVDKMQYMFGFIKENVVKRLERAVTKDNYLNLINFFTVYSADLEEVMVKGLAQYADEELTDRIFEILETGTDAQKTYCSKYFCFVKDTISVDELEKNMFSDFENLTINTAEALSGMNCQEAFNKALATLKSDDDFAKIKATRFLVAFGDKNAVNPILEAIQSSKMVENIAGQLPYLENLIELIRNYDEIGVLRCVDGIVTGLAEVLPLSSIIDYDLYGFIKYLLDSNQTPLRALALIKFKMKFELICENEEYTFDEDKATKQELKDILGLLNSKNGDFWTTQTNCLSNLLTIDEDGNVVLSTLQVVKELNLIKYTSQIKNLIHSKSEIIIAETISTLKVIGEVESLDKSAILASIKNENLKAIVENLFI